MPDGESASLSVVREIEERAFNAWPALETRVVRGWLMRFSAGYTKRANSVNAWYPDVPFTDIIPHATELYGNRHLPLVVRLSPLAGADTDSLLEARNFSRIDETIVMTAPLNELAIAPDSAVTAASTPSPEWLSGFATANGVSHARRSIHDSMVANIAVPVAFAQLSTAGIPIAWGIAVVERGIVGLFDIVTDPFARRKGAGRRLVGHMLHWAQTQGATSAYLQVVATNIPAIALYRHFGFREAYRYHYRIAPN